MVTGPCKYLLCDPTAPDTVLTTNLLRMQLDHVRTEASRWCNEHSIILIP